MSTTKRLETLSAALVALTPSCFHYFAPSNAKVPLVVWNEDSEGDSFDADNHKVRQVLTGFVEYFTKTEYDPMFDQIQEALDGIEGLSWTWEATQYGDPTRDDDNLIHHTWSWRMR